MERLSFSGIDHIGFVVRDLQEAIAHYESLGMGPITRSKRKLSMSERWSAWEGQYKLDIVMAKIGQVNIELIQPVSGESLWRDFLDKLGEGINHIGVSVEDIEKEMDKARSMGLQPLTYAKFQGGGGAAYYDTGKVGGILLEVVQWPKD